jgi:hypothetical protein
MKRLIYAILAAMLPAVALLFSACAPPAYMIATLTQLPFAATPPTKTPQPTTTPYPTWTIIATLTAVETATTEATPTAISTERTIDPTIAVALTLAAVPEKTTITPAACPPFSFDTTLPDPETPELFIGRHYDLVTPPPGVNNSSSGLLENNSYSWARVNVKDREMYWIQKMVCYDTQGVAYWEIVETIAYHSRLLMARMNHRRRQSRWLAISLAGPSRWRKLGNSKKKSPPWKLLT